MNYTFYSFPLNEAKTTEWLSSKISTIEDVVLKEHYQELMDLYLRKLYHQLTDSLEKMVLLPQFERGHDLIDLYQNFISDFEKKMNQLRLAQMAIVISNQLEEVEPKIDFLQNICSKLKESNEQAFILIYTTLGAEYLRTNRLDEVKVIVETSKDKLDRLTGVDPIVSASFYSLSAYYQKERGTDAEFFSDMMLYLAYSSLEKISLAHQREIAFNLCIAALVGDTIFNFGELVIHPILKSLVGTNDEWIVSFIEAFHTGNLEVYNSVVNTHSDRLQSQAKLLQNAELMKNKIAILTLMEIAFHKPSEDRLLSFSEIAQALSQPVENVELLIMRALSLKLMRGTIDEFDQVFHVQWVQPRVLSPDQISSLKLRLNDWHKKVDNMLQFIVEESPEFL